MSRRKKISLFIMALIYVGAGINHFVHPDTYSKIVPHVLPYTLEIVYISGVVEIIAGVLLLWPTTMRIGAWLIILLLVAVFPANIQMSIDYWRDNNPYFWLTILRLPLQAVLIWWAWKFAKKYPATAR
jgi:uncharacterized membrane protein